ncbi:MAG: hypothetical protein P1U86_15485 [Verrucomicrobiales bacterium]|nr:hypothetical protein [Verrucomicrobiales bacterium]
MGARLPLLKGESQGEREFVFTQIDSKAGGAAVPMRAVQNAKYGYIYNPFSDGEYYYRNNNEGATMAAMNKAAKTDPAIAARVDVFRYRVPEEFYDLEADPNCLENLIDEPELVEVIKSFQENLFAQMEKTDDPMLMAFINRENRAVVDAVITKTYGPQKSVKSKQQKMRPGKKSKK